MSLAFCPFQKDADSENKKDADSDNKQMSPRKIKLGSKSGDKTHQEEIDIDVNTVTQAPEEERLE